MAKSGDYTVSRKEDIYTRQVGFDLVLLDTQEERLHVLNSVGAVIWHSISADRSLREIADAVCLAYDLPKKAEERVTEDVIYFTERLKQNDLIGEPAPRKKKKDLKVTIPDREISRVDARYQPPSIKTLSLEEVEQLNKVEGNYTPRFADTWHPDQPS